VEKSKIYFFASVYIKNEPNRFLKKRAKSQIYFFASVYIKNEPNRFLKKRAKSQIYFFASVYIKNEPKMNTITSIEEEPDVVSPFNKTAIIIIKITINNKYT
jgi:hypothetical protein